MSDTVYLNDEGRADLNTPQKIARVGIQGGISIAADDIGSLTCAAVPVCLVTAPTVAYGMSGALNYLLDVGTDYTPLGNVLGDWIQQ